MKGFKPWRSCNSACIATHQDYDEMDEDDEDDDDEDDDEDDDGVYRQLVSLKLTTSSSNLQLHR